MASALTELQWLSILASALTELQWLSILASALTGISFDRAAVALHFGFSFDKAAVACAILEGTSGFEPLSEMIAPMYFKLVIVPSYLDLLLDALVGFGLNGPLRQYFSLYRAVSQKGREKREIIDERKNVQTTPTRT